MDDEEPVRDSLALMLKRIAFEVRAFESGRHFLGVVNDLPLGAIILDMRMGEIGGVELLNELRRRGRNDPAIVVTAESDAVSRRAAFNAGAFELLNKPVDPEVLLCAVRAALELVPPPPTEDTKPAAD